MAKRQSPGDSVVSRLAQRNQGGLYRRQLPGGGEVYTGPTATRALRSIGARAFTMDKSIFVAEDFDADDPQDQALYAHERHHQLNSGGDGAAQSYYDAEELAARAIERMVLHRSASGEDFGSILRDVDANTMRSESDVIHRNADVSKGVAKGGPEDAAEAAYAALLQQGMTHEGIVRMLANGIVEQVTQQAEQQAMQGGSVGFL